MIKRRAPELILSVIAGLMLLGQGMLFLAGMFLGLPPTDETLNELRTTLGEEGFGMFQIRNTIAGLTSGGAILLLSFLLNKRPQESKRLGVMIIILASMSIVGMGFLNLAVLPAVVLGIIGGALAIMKGRRVPVLEGPAPEKEDETMKFRAGPEVPEDPIAYRCSICNIDFGSDEELRAHMISRHIGH